YFVLWLLRGGTSEPGLPPGGRVLLTVLPAAVVAVVAVGAASQDWGAGLMILLAAAAVIGLIAVASAGAAGSRTLAYTMVTVGVVLLPSVAQVTYVEMGGMGGPGLKGLWIPFCVAGVLAVAAAVAVQRSSASGQWLTQLGLLSMVAGLCSVRVLVPSADGLVLVVPFALLAAGAAVALTAALSEVRAEAAMSGLALCFPGVLAGYLLGTGMQKALLDQSSRQEFVDSYVGVLHLWALAGGFLVVAVIVLVSVMARRTQTADGPPPAEPGENDGVPPVPPPAQSPEANA